MNKYMMRCALNGVELYSLSDRIYIQEITEKPMLRTDTAPRAHYGLTASGFLQHESMTVEIAFMIKERSPAYRAEILQRINGWATEGYLTVGHRPGQRMYARCTDLPVAKTFRWTEEMSIVFTAYNEACWEDAEPLAQTVTDETNAALAAFRARGTMPCFLEADIVNTSGETLTEITLSANGDTIALTGLSVADGKTVSLFYDEEHYMIIQADGQDVLDKRTGADDLMLNPGDGNQVSCVTDVACDTTFKARGMYR